MYTKFDIYVFITVSRPNGVFITVSRPNGVFITVSRPNGVLCISYIY